MSLTKKIILFMLIGAALGIALNVLGLNQNEFIDTYLTNGLFAVIGKLFVNALQMLVVPLVFVSLFCGTAALREPSHLGSIGGKTLGLYLLTTTIALVLAISVTLLIEPGAGVVIPSDLDYQAKASKSLVDVLIDMVPKNPVAAMAEGQMLPIIIFSILLGLSATMAGEPGQRVIAFFRDLNAVIMKLVVLIMHFAPYAVFALMAKVFTELGVDAIADLAGYFFTVLAMLLVHGLLIYPLFLKLFSGLDPWIFMKKMRAAVTFAFGTSSSNATIPVTMRTLTERMGVDRSIASFTVPFGATINMDGTAIMQGVATVFLAQAYGVDLTTGQLLTVVLMATMASIGAAGVPSVGLVMLQGVLLQVGLPIEGIAIILGIDRLLDMTRTAVNITGDSVVTCIVAKSDDSLDMTIYQDPKAGEME